ncbi:MAG: histidinol-phosphatase [Spirochaetaceae bacterium]|jgi:histidinol-phosphatase (PHP family)|nr:histidinol-phosphatase [Spirochaetaceae bacterium]
MTYTCIHTHTTFCDGGDDIETMCRAAYEKGFASLGFSSHAPIRKKTGIDSDWHISEDRFQEYLDEVRDARIRWAGKLPVYCGLEVDYIQGLMGPADRDLQALELDYLIGSVHYLIPPDGGEPFPVDDSPECFDAHIRNHFKGDGEAVMERYWDAVDAMIRAGGFDLLGHPDLVKKNNAADQYFSTAGSAYRSRLEKTASLAAQSGVVVEVNTGGIIRGWIRDPYPGQALLRLLAGQEVPLAITADAHRAEHLGSRYEDARRAMRDAGVRRHFLFEGRRDRRPVWTAEDLL